MGDEERSDKANTFIQCWKIRPKGESCWLYLRAEDLKETPDHLAGCEPNEIYELAMFFATQEEIDGWSEFDGW